MIEPINREEVTFVIFFWTPYSLIISNNDTKFRQTAQCGERIFPYIFTAFTPLFNTWQPQLV